MEACFTRGAEATPDPPFASAPTIPRYSSGQKATPPALSALTSMDMSAEKAAATQPSRWASRLPLPRSCGVKGGERRQAAGEVFKEEPQELKRAIVD